MIILIREFITGEHCIAEVHPKGPTVKDFDEALRRARVDGIFYGSRDMFNLETGTPIAGWTWNWRTGQSLPEIIADPLLREAALADFRAKRKEHHDTERKTD